MTTHLQYGIDLGTTNSCVARATGLDLRVYQNNDQMNVTPSVVRVLKTGRVITGKRAYNAIADDAANIAREFKRWMGQKAGKDFPSTGRSMSAEELSAEIIKSLRDDVARAEGESPTASVVTVPAAFGALQCEATARACNLGGLVQAPLLQEPLAAAIAYGIAPGARDQRWLVFDFGGGTLDVAVVSTKDGRLSVLEHRGNNLLGGKDIDRAIVEHVLLPAVKASFRLPDPAEDPARFARLMQHLLVSAEEAKIDLSSTESVVVSLIDLGLDADGRAIELELSVSRSELERTMEPILDRAIRLAEEALTGARTASDDLDRVLLVGGPTQSPHVRDTIASRLKARVDLSVDPMTAVARGAALYAATIEREYHPPLSATRVTAEATRQRIVLAYDAVSATLSPIIAGRLDGGAGRVSELRLETDGGFWTSGWLSLLDGTFETQPMLQEGKASRIFIYGRDATGTLVDVEPDELSIRHGLVVASPPLPHTLSVEVMRANGKMELDPIFKRGTSLPAERSVRYRADRSAKPGLAETSLAIKLWEGEAFSNPSDNDWVGHVTIEATEISRTIPEGSEIEITIRIDASRIITIEAFVPILNQHFADRLFVPKEQEKDYDEIASTMPSEIEDYRARLTNIRSAMDGIAGSGDKHSEEVGRVQAELEDLTAQSKQYSGLGSEDPDQAKRLAEGARNVRARLSNLEGAVGGVGRASSLIEAVRATRESTREVVERFGDAIEKKELMLLEGQLGPRSGAGSDEQLEKLLSALKSLRWRVLAAQDWWWRELFDSLKAPERGLERHPGAVELFSEGDAAVRKSDGTRLRHVVNELWKLLPKDQLQKDQERVIRSGLRRY